ncbi:hypothetical protein [Halodesulfovibrio aestuarii]|uniref:Uncharacterized protein n=1 Tax=Halodesulfovibrio aestuarii TaxID=126333 RepID=A0ABV4JTD3_9BACT
MQYNVVFKNNSKNNMNFCLFQKNPDLEKYEALSLAWLVKSCAPDANLEMKWEVDYGCSWSRDGALGDVAKYRTWQTKTIDPSNSNVVTLSYNHKVNDFYFGPLRPSSESGKGTLHIIQDGSVPAGLATVGVSMAGIPAIALKAQPNFTYKFTPHPKYWAVFGDFTPGDVIDVEELTNVCEIEFKAGESSMYVELNRDNTWSEPKPLG